MKRLGINIPTIIGFALVPIIAVFRVAYNESEFNYGTGTISDESVVLLIFAIYCFFVSTFNFIRAHKAWKQQSEDCIKLIKSAHLYNIIFAISLAFLLKPIIYAFLLGLIFVSLPWLFPIGIVLLVLGGEGTKYKKEKANWYLSITFIVGLLFSLAGALPALAVSLIWIGGGISLCYCPVNRRSFKKDFLLKPLYIYRRRKLARRLNV